MVYAATYDYGNLAPVLAGNQGLRTAGNYEIDETKVTSFAGADNKIQRIVYPGCFLGSIPGSTKVRVLPRTKLAAALVASTTTSFTVRTGTARNFIAGEALAVIAPYAIFTFALNWAAADTATAVINGVTVTTTAIGTDKSVEAAAMATAINANPYLLGKVVAIANGETVLVYADDMATRYTTTASEVTAGTGTFAAGAATMVAGGTAIGTISTVTPLTDTITLSSASAISLPIGFPIGVAASAPNDLGMLSPNQEVDLLYSANNFHGAFVGCSVYESRLPYIDGQLKSLFPEIRYV